MRGQDEGQSGRAGNNKQLQTSHLWPNFRPQSRPNEGGIMLSSFYLPQQQQSRQQTALGQVNNARHLRQENERSYRENLERTLMMKNRTELNLQRHQMGLQLQHVVP
ncbi:hypothetical protein M5D96_008242 [Drosophila gunungcola]|uniref:Uncharacterized protein n=1 Tax=Drosophila gunungcola TaxID=103775 RepID=A0A9P9YKN5_9MUSC|nr:hypothetical protein M5D96_008242 [Drosophila gunungcola]